MNWTSIAKAVLAVVLLFIAVLAGYWFFVPPSPSPLPLPEGYHAHAVPRADRGAGTVFVGRTNSTSALRIDTVICDSLYLADPPERQQVPVALADAVAQSSLGAKLIQNVLGESFSASFSGDRSSTITWGEIYEDRYRAEDAFTSDGEPRFVSAACKQRIDQFLPLLNQQDGQEKIYIIVGALVAEGLTFTSETDLAAGGGGTLAVPGQSESTASVEITGTQQGSSTLKIDQPLNIAYLKPWLLIRWDPSSMTGDDLVTVVAEPSGLLLED